jgi:hypothetical protein
MESIIASDLDTQWWSHEGILREKYKKSIYKIKNSLREAISYT